MNRLTLAGVLLALAAMAAHAQDASPVPDASASPAAEASAAAEASPASPAAEASPAASPAAEASPAPDASAAAAASPAAASPEPAASAEASSDEPAAEPSPAASPAPDPFLELEKILTPVRPPAARTAQQRDPFVPPAIIQSAVAPKQVVKPKAPKKRPPSSIQRAKGFAISGVFFGERLRAVRIGGKRVQEGEWFDEAEGRVTISDAGAFQVMTVTPARIVFANRAGERLERDTQLRRQPKLEPLPPEPEPVESLAAPPSGETTPEASVEPGASPSPNP